MHALLVSGQVLVLLAMIGVSLWGRKNLHDEARTQARLGTSGFDWSMTKNASLVYAPAIGSVVVIGTLAVGDPDNADGETVAAIGLAILVMLLLAHWSSIKRAAR